MAGDKREWTVPGPVRALLWWPPTAFVLVMLSMETAPVSIAASGIVLMMLGAVVPAVTARLRRGVPAAAPLAQDPPTIEMPTLEMPRLQEPRRSHGLGHAPHPAPPHPAMPPAHPSRAPRLSPAARPS
jgi:hypothetical protein